MKILVKADRLKLEEFKELGFENCELYLPTNDNLNILPITSMDVNIVHMPHKRTSHDDVESVINYAKKCFARKVIVHADVFNSEFIDNLFSSEVVICVENVPLVPDIVDYLKNVNNNFELVLDIEHLYESAVINKAHDIHKYVFDFVDKMIESKFKISVVHLSGCDYMHFDVNLPPPQIGEHLPIKYKGKIGQISVEDRIDYNYLFQKIKQINPEYIVFEFHDRLDYNIKKELVRAKKIIENEF